MFGLIGSDAFNLSDDNGPLVIRTSVAMMCVSGLSVILRFTARKIARQHLWWDDWLILAALPLAWSVCICNFAAIATGNFGRHVQRGTPEAFMNFFKALYADQIVYLFAIALIKFSILAFIRRIFSVPSTKIPAYVIAGIIIAWLTANTLVGIFSCLPVYGFWDKLIQPQCVNTVNYFFGVAIPNIITDAALMMFPLPLIWKLNLPTHQRIALSGIFLLGGFIMVISSLRVVTIFEAKDSLDFTWNFVPLGIWNAVETNTGILLVCLPSMQPLLRLMLGKRARNTSKGYIEHSGSGGTAKSRLKTNPSELSAYSQTGDADDDVVEMQEGVFTRVGANPSSGPTCSCPEGAGINVQMDTQWKVHRPPYR